jgi:hypothetical protein
MHIANREMQRTPGAYWHLFPSHVQARRAIWNGVANDGTRFLDNAFPASLVEKRHDQDMMIRYTNGSTWQLIGSDYYDRLVGANVRGVVFSEWALCDPRAWTYLRPIIRENGGWAMFITTFRGRNHAYQMFQQMQKNPEWSCQILTVADTGLLTPEDIDNERRGGMSEAHLQQEYYCNPLASLEGSIYGGAMTKLITDRCGDHPYDPKIPVTASWSLAHMPVNISVVFSQGLNVIGSASWMFPESFSVCLSEVLSGYPWQCAEHIVMAGGMDLPEAKIFHEAGIYARVVIEPNLITLTHTTQAIIERCSIDTSPRQFEEGTDNNLLLIDALNGYAAKETPSSAWSMAGSSSYSYLTRAFESFAVWCDRQGTTKGLWTSSPNYQQSDRAVI